MVEELYKCYEVLDKAADKTTERASFEKLIEGVKGGNSEKRLSSQFIAQFFKHFISIPEVSETALNALFDLCEFQDSTIRKQAARDLVVICKACPQLIQRIADILTQLFQMPEPTELHLLNQHLMDLMRLDCRATLSGIFNQIQLALSQTQAGGHEEDNMIRARAIRFVQSRVPQLGTDQRSADVETFIIGECERLLASPAASALPAEEFLALVNLLFSLRTMQTVQGRSRLVKLISDQALGDAALPDFNPVDPDELDRLLTCTGLVLPLLSKNVHCSQLLEHFATCIFPLYSKIGTDGVRESKAEKPAASVALKVELLRRFAELVLSGGNPPSSSPAPLVKRCSDLLVELLPTPPQSADGEEAESPSTDDLPLLEAEALLVSMHFLGKTAADSAAIFAEANLAELNKRMHFLALRVQEYNARLRHAVTSTTNKPVKGSEELKAKSMGLSVSTNIMGAIRDLMHSPPIYKALLVPSWKPKLGSAATSPTPAAAAPAGSAQKRTAPSEPSASADDGSAAKRIPRVGAEQRFYQPPSGRFSERSTGNAPAPAPAPAPTSTPTPTPKSAAGATAAAPQAPRPAPRSMRW